MSYISPFKLLPFLKVDDFDSINYNLLRRKLLAEYELNDNQPLEINGDSLGKSEALIILEELKNADVLQQHIIIYKDKSLLSFLEGSMSGYIFSIDNYTKSIPQIAHYTFVEVLNKEIVKCYRKNDYQLLNNIMSFPVKDLIRDNLGLSIYERFYRAIRSDLIELKEILEIDSIPEKLKRLIQVQEIYLEDRAKCINLLPDEFSNLINDFAKISISLSVQIYKGKGDKRIPLLLCLFVLSLDTTDEYLDLARKNYKAINKYGEVSGLVNFKKYVIAIVSIVVVLYLGEYFFKLYNSEHSGSPRQEIIDHGPWVDIVNYVSNTISRLDSTDNKSTVLMNGSMAKTTFYDQYFLDRKKISFQNHSDKDIVLGVFVSKDKMPKQSTDELTHSWFLLKHKSSMILESDTLHDGYVAVIGDKWLSSDKGFLSIYSKEKGCHYNIQPNMDGYFYGDVSFYFLDSSSFIKKDSILTCIIE